MGKGLGRGWRRQGGEAALVGLGNTQYAGGCEVMVEVLRGRRRAPQEEEWLLTP